MKIRTNATKRRFAALVVVMLASVAVLAAAPNDIQIRGASPVADAAMEGDTDTVRELLRQGADVNAAQGDGMTALHWAAMREDLEMTEMLLYAGANRGATTRLGDFTPLILASKTGNAALIDTLAEGADVNEPTSYGTTPVMYAAASGRVDAVRTLIEHGADVNAAETARGRTALMFAAVNNGADVIRLLAAEGADVSATTKVMEIAKIEKEWSEANRARFKERNEQLEAKKRAEAEAAGEPLPEEKPEADKPKKGKGVFTKMFGWLPGVGEEGEAMPQEQRRRRFRRTPYGELVGNQGGIAAIHLAARQGHVEAVDALLEVGADLNHASGGDHTTPMLIASVNGHFDLATSLLDRGADPNITSEAGAGPLYAAINLQWAPKALYPQPRAQLQQENDYLTFMERLLKNGADPNQRLEKKIWYSGYNFDLSGVDETGATPFWRAAYGTDVPAMKLLVKYGADPHVPTTKAAADPTDGIGPRDEEEDEEDESGLPPVPPGGPSITPLLAAAGAGYGEGFAANSHRHAEHGFMEAVRYLVDELGADVNARDHKGYNALHHAAARGDTEMIQYLADKGCDVMAVSRRGQTTADMANGPVQRIQPFPEAVDLLVSLGAVNNDNCVSC